MAGKRKIIKKKLREPDEFISFTEQAFLFVKGHLKTIAQEESFFSSFSCVSSFSGSGRKRKKGRPIRNLVQPWRSTRCSVLPIERDHHQNIRIC